MSRIVITDPIPAKPVAVPPDAIVVTPGRSASDALGRPGRDLRTIAKQALRRSGIGLATPIQSAEAMKRAAAEIFGPAMASASARRCREILGATLRSGIDLIAFEEAASPRVLPVARLARRYSELLKRSGLVDSEASLVEAAKFSAPQSQKLFIYGYFRGRDPRARPEEFGFIDRIAADGSIFYLPCGEGEFYAVNRQWVSILEECGWEVRRDIKNKTAGSDPIENLALCFSGVSRPDTAARASAPVEALSYPNIEAEIRGVLGKAKASVASGVPPGNIAVVCRAPELYMRLLKSIAHEYKVPIEMDHDIPLAETSFGEFIALLFETVDLRIDEPGTVQTKDHQRGFLFEPTFRFLSHRFGTGLDGGQLSLSRRSHPANFEAWQAITPEIECLKVDGERNREAWTNWLRDIVLRWNIRGVAALEATELLALNAFLDGLAQLSREHAQKAITLKTFAGEALDVLADLKTPLSASVGGIRILQPNAVVGGEFDKVFIVGMAEGLLPAPSVDSNVIDFCERKELALQGIHFEDALEVPRWEALTFYFSLLACRGSLVLTCPRFANGNELIPSAFFKMMGLEPRSDVNCYVSSAEEYRRTFLPDGMKSNGDAVLAAARHQHQVESSRESAGPPDRYDGVTGIPVKRRRWSATSLTRLGSCPFKWFASDVLKLNTPIEAEGELRGDVCGRLYHKTLELSVKRSPKCGDVRSAVLEVLEEEFANAELDDEFLSYVANWELRRGELLERLRLAVVSDDFFPDGAEVLGTEREFEAELAGVLVHGKVDRIDRLSDGRLFALDYKSGLSVARVKDESGYLRTDLQLPIYSTVALPTLYPNEPVAAGGFFSIKDSKLTRGKEVDLKAIIRKLLALVDRGEFAVDPDVKQDACEFCEFDIVCRRGPRNLKKAVSQ